MQVYVAGKGIITAIGNNVAETLQSFRKSKSGISHITILPTVHAGTLPAGEVKFTNEQLAELAQLPASVSRTGLFSLIAAREAINDANIPHLNKWRVGFISANTVGGMDHTENIFKAFHEDHTKADLSDVEQHDSGAVTGIVAEKLGIKDFVTTISTACSSSANSIMYGARLIKNNLADVIIAGGTDALCRFTLNGFNSLMILDDRPCTPYDENRKGLNLGEGAGYVVLVSEKVAETLPKKPSAKLVGYANANDAFHQTASSPEGKGNFLAMTGALAMSGLPHEAIDYINLHGTGTLNNDVSESIAIQRVFGMNVPKMSSTKAFTGHTLGACAGVEAVFSIIAMEEGMIFPNLRWQTQMKEVPFKPVTELMTGVEVNHVMSNSFGFGGNCSSLIFSKIK
ncbi:MAG: beta-ketoacyl-[acyl-carrier-protein] synthase family protein [Chitinophagales bacterium]|nr:beta-ketoacyl-[acyl-carrier-protein] synthase family protein [Chitinophagales bacterium]